MSHFPGVTRERTGTLDIAAAREGRVYSSRRPDLRSREDAMKRASRRTRLSR